jgi:hypothetical protein
LLQFASAFRIGSVAEVTPASAHRCGPNGSRRRSAPRGPRTARDLESHLGSAGDPGDAGAWLHRMHLFSSLRPSSVVPAVRALAGTTKMLHGFARELMLDSTNVLALVHRSSVLPAVRALAGTPMKLRGFARATELRSRRSSDPSIGVASLGVDRFVDEATPCRPHPCLGGEFEDAGSSTLGGGAIGKCPPRLRHCGDVSRTAGGFAGARSACGVRVIRWHGSSSLVHRSRERDCDLHHQSSVMHVNLVGALPGSRCRGVIADMVTDVPGSPLGRGVVAAFPLSQFRCFANFKVGAPAVSMEIVCGGGSHASQVFPPSWGPRYAGDRILTVMGCNVSIGRASGCIEGNRGSRGGHGIIAGARSGLGDAACLR